LYTPFHIGTCHDADWGLTFDREGWGKCDDKQFLVGLWRSDNKGNDDGIHLIEWGRCCSSGLYRFGSCYNQNVLTALDRNNNWAKCKEGTYMTGLYRSGGKWLSNIERVKCCGVRGE